MKLAHNPSVEYGPHVDARRPPSALPRSFVTPSEALGALAATAFLFVLFSRTFEFALSTLHIPLILSISAFLLAVIGGRLFQKLNQPTTTLLLALTAWMLLASVFSVWRGGSADVMLNLWIKNLLVYVLVVANIRTIPQLSLLLRGLAGAFLVVAWFGLSIGQLTDAGRLALPTGVYANPNEFALALGSGLIVFLVVAMNQGRSWFVRLFAVAVLPVLFYLLLESGSRAGVIAALVGLAYVSFTSTLGGKVKAVGIGLIVGVIGLSYSGTTMLERFGQALGYSTSQSRVVGEVDGSTSERLQLLEDSFWLTAQNPVLGVGPGMFMVAQNDLAKDRGRRRGDWSGTHNTYAQFASEAGIPALLLFVGIVIMGYRGLRRADELNRATPNPRQKQIRAICQTVRGLWVLYLVSFLFFHFAYSFFMCSLIGITTATVSCINRELGGARFQAARSARS